MQLSPRIPGIRRWPHAKLEEAGQLRLWGWREHVPREVWDPPPPRKWRPSTDRPPELDVGVRRGDILAIARRQGLWRACLALGWDPEDLEQEVLLRLHRRQSTPRSAYDPSRAGLPKYLHVATRSVLSHIQEGEEAESRGGHGGRLAREQLGQIQDVGSWADDTDEDGWL